MPLAIRHDGLDTGVGNTLPHLFPAIGHKMADINPRKWKGCRPIRRAIFLHLVLYSTRNGELHKKGGGRCGFLLFYYKWRGETLLGKKTPRTFRGLVMRQEQGRDQ